MATEKLKIGSVAPDFNLPGVDGNLHSLSEASEKKGFAVIFSCNHCPYVKAYEDRMIVVQEKFKKDIQFFVINSNDLYYSDEDSFDHMVERAKEKNFNFPYLRDESQETAKAYDATHTPEIFLFNEKRELVFHGKLDDNWKEPENVKEKYLENAIEELLAGAEISTPETFTIGCTIKWK